jgi:hypothetical protein
MWNLQNTKQEFCLLDRDFRRFREMNGWMYACGGAYKWMSRTVSGSVPRGTDLKSLSFPTHHGLKQLETSHPTSCANEKV